MRTPNDISECLQAVLGEFIADPFETPDSDDIIWGLEKKGLVIVGKEEVTEVINGSKEDSQST